MSYEVLDFDEQVLKRSHSIPVLVDFWAPWCGPCKMLGPLIEKLAGEAGGRWELVKVDTEAHQDLAARHQIASIPAVKLFRNGEVTAEFLGFKPEAQLRAWIDGQMPTAGAIDLEHAAELIDEGRLEQARPLLEGVLAAEPKRHAARLLLAEVLLSTDALAAAALLEQVPDDADEAAHAQALHLLATQAAQPASAFPEDPVKPRFLEGLAGMRGRDWDAALAAFIDVAERRRTYAGGIAAELGKAIFRYLGIRHPIADKHYRRLSSVLNS